MDVGCIERQNSPSPGHADDPSTALKPSKRQTSMRLLTSGSCGGRLQDLTRRAACILVLVCYVDACNGATKGGRQGPTSASMKRLDGSMYGTPTFAARSVPPPMMPNAQGIAAGGGGLGSMPPDMPLNTGPSSASSSLPAASQFPVAAPPSGSAAINSSVLPIDFSQVGANAAGSVPAPPSAAPQSNAASSSGLPYDAAGANGAVPSLTETNVGGLGTDPSSMPPLASGSTAAPTPIPASTSNVTSASAQGSSASKNAGKPPTAQEEGGEDIEAATFPEDGTDPVRMPTGPSFNNSLQLPIDQGSCQGLHALQLDRALAELAGLAELGLKSLLDTPLSPLNQRYWGSSDEADLSIPVGVLTRLTGANKTNIAIRCDGNKTLCSTDKVARAEGGYVSASPSAGSATAITALMKMNVTNNIMLCPESFAGGKAARKWIEEICLDEWTLSANSPTVFWPASLLSLLLQAPALSSPLMQTPVHAYANVLELARRDPLSSTHSVYTYLYFLLDVFAQKHIKGGCVGQVMGRVRESRR